MADEIMDIQQEGDVVIVTPKGNLFHYRFEDLRNGYNEIYRRIFDPAVKHLIIDFQHVEHFGSAFIGMLIKLAKQVRKDGGELVLCSLSASGEDVLKSLMLLENVNADFFIRKSDTLAAAKELLAGL